MIYYNRVIFSNQLPNPKWQYNHGRRDSNHGVATFNWEKYRIAFNAREVNGSMYIFTGDALKPSPLSRVQKYVVCKTITARTVYAISELRYLSAVIDTSFLMHEVVQYKNTHAQRQCVIYLYISEFLKTRDWVTTCQKFKITSKF